MTDHSLGHRIRDGRNLKGLTQQQLADVLGVVVRTVRNWESGSTVPRSKVPQLERALNIRLDVEDDAVLHVEEVRGDDESLQVFFAKHGARSTPEMIVALGAAMSDLAARGQDAATPLRHSGGSGLGDEGQQEPSSGERARVTPPTAAGGAGASETPLMQLRRLRGAPRSAR